MRDDVNQLVQTWTPGAPLGLSAWEAGYADGTQDTVYLVQRYCRLSGAGGAKAFGRGLARRLWLLEPEEYTVLKETPDTLVLANYEDGPGFHQTLLLVVDGPDVLFLHYWGGGARSAMWAPRRRRGLRNIRPRRAGGEPPPAHKSARFVLRFSTDIDILISDMRRMCRRWEDGMKKLLKFLCGRIFITGLRFCCRRYGWACFSGSSRPIRCG